MALRRIARLTNRRELWYDPSEMIPVIRDKGLWPGWNPAELKRAADRREMVAAVRRLCEKQEAERMGRPLKAHPEHMATLSAAIGLNDEIAPWQRRYGVEVSSGD